MYCRIWGLLLANINCLAAWHHRIIVFLQELLEFKSSSALLLVPILLEHRLLVLLGLELFPFAHMLRKALLLARHRCPFARVQ